MRSLAGFEKWHSNILQVATESLHPHWQANRAPTRRTSTLGFSAAVCAHAAKAVRIAITTGQLLFNRGMFFGNSHDFGAGVLQFDLARHQAHKGTADQHKAANPDPRHQRK